MLLYTKEPYEMIFPGAEVSAQDMPQVISAKIDGVLVEGFEKTDGIHITRLYSTNPKHYLEPGFSPGSVVRRTK